MHIIRDLNLNGNCFNKCDLEVRHYVKFDFSSPVSFDRCMSLSAKFRSFLTFAVGFPISIIDECAMADSMDWKHEYDGLEIKHSFVEENKNTRRLFQHHMFFCSQIFSYDELSTLILNWFKFYDDYQSAIDVYLHAVIPYWGNESVLVLQIQFTNGILNICQAIEKYSNLESGVDFRNTRNKFNELKQKAFDKIKKNKTIIGLSEEELNFFNDPFKIPKTEGEIPFKKRILFLLNEVKDSIVGFINTDDFENFASSLKDCRDDLTHINHDNDIGDNHDLPYLFYYSQILFYALIAYKLGIDQLKINQIIKNSEKFGRYYNGNEK